MKLNIDGKDYTFVYSIEASLCEECVEKTTSIMVAIGEAQSEEDMKKMINSLSNIPQTALSMFYAGLLEKHGDVVRSKADAKVLLKKYLEQHSDEENANFYGILMMVFEQMQEDGFFKLIGLEQMMNEASQTEGMETAPKRGKRKSITTVSKN